MNQPRGLVNDDTYRGASAAEDPYADHVWETDADLVRSADKPHAQDDDFGQAGVLVRDVMDGAARLRLVANVVEHLTGLSLDLRVRAVEYWRRVDDAVGARIATRVGVPLDHDDLVHVSSAGWRAGEK